MFLKKIHKGIRMRCAIGLLLVLMTFQLCACGKKAEESQEASFYIPQVYRCSFVSLSEEDGDRNASANSFLFEVTDDNLGIEDLTAAGINYFHYVVIDSGEILYDEKDISKLKPEQRKLFRRKNIGMVFQNFELLPILNVRENILLPLRLNHIALNEEYFNEIVTTLA